VLRRREWDHLHIVFAGGVVRFEPPQLKAAWGEHKEWDVQPLRLPWPNLVELVRKPFTVLQNWFGDFLPDLGKDGERGGTERIWSTCDTRSPARRDNLGKWEAVKHTSSLKIGIRKRVKNLGKAPLEPQRLP
jgi:hypothetical protein